MRDKCQEMFAAEAMTLDELKTKLGALKETRETAEKELAALAGKRERLEAMERDRDLILESYVTLAPEALDAFLPRNVARCTLYSGSPSSRWRTELENERRVRRGDTDLGNRRNVKTFLL